MATPGDTECHAVMDCAPGRWGNIPVDATSEYVDASYADGDSDGSEAKPWTTITEAVTAAEPGALIAIAEGSYGEDVVVEGKSVRLWGVCPAKVELVGIDPGFAALLIHDVASGMEVRGIAVRAGGLGMLIVSSVDVVVDKVWVHDTASRGINIQDDLGVTSVSVTDTLIERSREFGLFVSGSAVTVERSVLRDTLPRSSDNAFGRGINVRPCRVLDGCDRPIVAEVTVRGSLVDQNHDIGVFVMGSVATVEGTVVRGTLPQASDLRAGRGINVQACRIQNDCDPAVRSSVTLRGSLVDRNHEAGLFVSGSDATVEATVVRGTLPHAFDQTGGRGISIEECDNDGGCIPRERSSVVVRHSLVEDNHEIGLDIGGSDATVEGTVVRGTLPRAVDQAAGRGINIHATCLPPVVCNASERANATVRGSLIEENRELGLSVSGSDALVEGTIVRDTLPRAVDQTGGRGINVQLVCTDTGCDPTTPSSITLRGSVVVGNREIGVYIGSSNAIVENTVVQGTLPEALDGQFGDGVALFSQAAAVTATVTVTGTRIENSARAGLSNFGGEAVIGSNHFDCNAFDLNGETKYLGKSLPFSFENLGGNTCGCGSEQSHCKIVSSALEAPPPASALGQ